MRTWTTAAARRRRHHPEAAAPDAEAAHVETDDPSLPERLRSARPEGRTETREPLFDESDVDRTIGQARGVEYDAEVEVVDGVTAIFHDAGHILGSAIIELRLRDGDQSTTVVFSGDIGRSNTAIIRDPT